MTEFYVTNTSTSLTNQHLQSLLSGLERCGIKKWEKKKALSFQDFYYLTGGKTDSNSEKTPK